MINNLFKKEKGKIIIIKAMLTLLKLQPNVLFTHEDEKLKTLPSLSRLNQPHFILETTVSI